MTDWNSVLKCSSAALAAGIQNVKILQSRAIALARLRQWDDFEHAISEYLAKGGSTVTAHRIRSLENPLRKRAQRQEGHHGCTDALHAGSSNTVSTSAGSGNALHGRPHDFNAGGGCP